MDRDLSGSDLTFTTRFGVSVPSWVVLTINGDGRLPGICIAFEIHPPEQDFDKYSELTGNCYASEMRSIHRYQSFRRTPTDAALDHMKRLADLVIAAVLLVLTFPLALAVALALRWEGPGPIFEWETCIDRGRRFQLAKFRTRVPDPEHTLPLWARETTRVGEFLCYTRIENLPQLYNLLRGDIGLIDRGRSSPSFLE